MSWLTLTPGSRPRRPAACRPGRDPSRAGGTPRRAGSASVSSTGASSSPPGPLTVRRVGEPEPGGVGGVDLQGAGVGAAPRAGTLCIQLLLERRWRRPMRTKPSAPRPSERAAAGRRRPAGRRQFDLARRGAQDLGEPGLQRAEVDAVRGVLEASRVRPSGWRRSRRRTGRGAASCRAGARSPVPAVSIAVSSSGARPATGEWGRRPPWPASRR